MIGTRRLSAARRARRKLVEGPGSLGTRFRARRWQLFVSLFPELRDMHVIDLGGRPDTWRWAGQPARRVTIVNLEPIPHVPEPWIDTVQGDACELPREVADASWDLVYSNSLLEHVGGHYRRMQLAENIEQLASRHWVQTPYRYFPVEPHWLFPMLQFLPLAVRARILTAWPFGPSGPNDYATSLRAVAQVELQTHAEMGMYFPASRMLRERVGPLTKSLIAVRDGAESERGG